MPETYQAMYQNEIRALKITVNDQTGAPFASEAASASVQDSNGNVVIDWATAQVGTEVTNEVTFLIGRTVTKNTGNYRIIWRLLQNEYIYYHITELEITEW